jgi:hypothetical protein
MKIIALKCHGKKPIIRFSKRLKLWIVVCACKCNIWKTGATKKPTAIKIWNDLINQSSVCDD